MRKHIYLAIATLFTGCSVFAASETEEKAADGMFFHNPSTEQEEAPAWWTEANKTVDERIRWWEEARFGCFVHWGISSHLGGVWKGKSYPGYSEHIQRMAQITQEEYRTHAADCFNPHKFDADQWIRFIKAAGMKYFIITAKHHDGFAMFDSDVSDWNIVDATPFARDPMLELKEACERHGIVFGFYYSHAFDWGHPDAPGNDWEWKNPGGDTLIGGENWWEDPVMGKELPRIYEKYVQQHAIPQMLELVEKYDPKIIWFDTPQKLPDSINWEFMEALRKASPDIIISGRLVYGHGDYISSCDKPMVYAPQESRYWEGVPTTNESYGWHSKDFSHKSPHYLTRLLAAAVARGGNMLMNIGPTGLGEIDAPDREILEAMASWMKLNRESIHGAGKTPLPVQPWGESTTKGNQLFLQVFEWPTDGELLVGGLTADPTSIKLLGSKESLVFKRLDNRSALIRLPKQAPCEIGGVVELRFDQPAKMAGNASHRLIHSHRNNELHVFDAKLSSGLELGEGCWWLRQDTVHGWTNENELVTWPIYLHEPGHFNVQISYYGDHPDNRYMIRVNEDTQIRARIHENGSEGDLKASRPYQTRNLGELHLPAGESQISLEADGSVEGELFNFRWIQLTPVTKRQ